MADADGCAGPVGPEPAGEVGHPCGGAGFGAAPRLELDQLLGQLVDRAQEVRAAQERLRGLLGAHQTIGVELDLPGVLRRIVESARELVGARYAALGVIGSDGHLTEFIHSGVSPETVAAIGHLPQGKGLLGALIDTPEPIRLSHIAGDPRSSGFPAGHPPMRSFLGVPIRVRGEVFGNLYLAESPLGEFTADDQELTLALATSAGIAIDNARLYAAAQTRGEWMHAATTVTHALLSPTGEPHDFATADGSGPLTMIVRLCRKVASADVVSVWLPAADPDRLRAEVAVGADDLIGLEAPATNPVFEQVLRTRVAVRLHAPEEGVGVLAPSGEDVGPVMILPLAGRHGGRGLVTVVRRRGRPLFSSEDLRMAAGFTNQAAVAMELADARTEQQRLALLDERDRIAADLHDNIIQRLFGAGLSLHSVAATMPPGRGAERVLGTVRELDEVITQIRMTIFELHRPTGVIPTGVRTRLLRVVSDLMPALGFEPVLRFTGPVDSAVSDRVAADLEAVVREALANIVRHARASAAEVELNVTATDLVLDVRDDGVGIRAQGRRSGLANMGRRAEQHGGSVTVRNRDPHGTEIIWTARR